jgi:hypothetical protein
MFMLSSVPQCPECSTRINFGTGILHLIQINHQPDATIILFITLTFVYSPNIYRAFSRPSSGAQ